MIKAFLVVLIAYVLAGVVALGIGTWFSAQSPIITIGVADLAATIVFSSLA